MHKLKNVYLIRVKKNSVIKETHSACNLLVTSSLNISRCHASLNVTVVPYQVYLLAEIARQQPERFRAFIFTSLRR